MLVDTLKLLASSEAAIKIRRLRDNAETVEKFETFVNDLIRKQLLLVTPEVELVENESTESNDQQD